MNLNSSEQSKNNSKTRSIPLINMSGISFTVIIFGYISLFAQSYSDNLKGPLLSQMMSDLNLNNTQAAWLFIVASITAFCGGLITSTLIQKTSRKTTLSLSWVFVSVASISFLFADSFYPLILSSLVLGLGFGICGVMQNLMISESSTDQSRAKALSGLHFMYAIGALLSPLLVHFFMNHLIHWKIVLASGSVIPLVLLLFSGNLHFSEIPVKASKALPELHRTHKKGPFLLASSIAFYVSAEILISTRIAIYVEKSLSMTPEKASNYLTVFFLFLSIGRFLFTVLKVKKSTMTQIYIGMAGSILFLILGLSVHPLLLTVTGITMAPLYALGITRSAEIYLEVMPKLLGFVQALSSLFIISMNFLFGILADKYGLRVAIWAAPFFLILSISSFYLHELRFKNLRL